LQKLYAGLAQRPGAANPNYWIAGEPYLNEVGSSDFSDNNLPVAACVRPGGRESDGVDPSDLKQMPSGGFVTQIRSRASTKPITMRVDKAPFNDVPVRQAFG